MYLPWSPPVFATIASSLREFLQPENEHFLMCKELLKKKPHGALCYLQVSSVLCFIALACCACLNAFATVFSVVMLYAVAIYSSVTPMTSLCLLYLSVETHVPLHAVLCCLMPWQTCGSAVSTASFYLPLHSLLPDHNQQHV